MASFPPLFYFSSSRIFRNRNTNSTRMTSSGSCSPSSPFSLSFSGSLCQHRPGHNWNFMTLYVLYTFLIFTIMVCLHRRGIKNIWKKRANLKPQSMSTIQGNLSSRTDLINEEDKPDHLLVLVHGIMGSPNDWICFEAELKKRLGRNFLIFVSSCNMYTKTFNGIDGSGKRLADEVMEIVKKTESLKKISFLAHSLGGLIARYAVAVLYTPYSVSDHTIKSNATKASKSKTYPSASGSIAGLDAIAFITLATPHLGVRGNKQLPFLMGMQFLEKLAAPIAPIFTGHTGSQLFLTDGKPEKPPLLLQMASDCNEGKFLSALGAFRCRVLYANVSYDHMVGWRTSSIRRKTENVEPPSQSLDGFNHIVGLENCPPVLSEIPEFPEAAAKAKKNVQNEPSAQNTAEYHEIMEEEMIDGLQQLGWIKVDVCFHNAKPWPFFFAHNNIQMKNLWFHNVGFEVVAHVADAIKQQDSSPCISASL